MNVNKLLSVVFLLMLSIRSEAQSLVAGDISMAASDKSVVGITLNNASNYVAVGFVISLPDGFSFTNKNDLASANHEIKTTALSKNSIKVIVYSSSNQPFADGEAAMLNLEFKAGVKEGPFQGIISKIEYSAIDNKLVTKDDITFNMDISGSVAMLGDANGDGNLNVADCIAIAHYLLGKAPENFNEEAANVNGDDTVNMADFIGVAHLLLYGTVEKPSNK